MRNLLIILLLPVFFIACSKGGDVEITVNVSNKRTDDVRLFAQGEEYIFKLDESGRSVNTITLTEPTYAYVYSRYGEFTLYLQPDKNIDISYDANDRSGRVFLYCDDNGINLYLSTERNLSRGKKINSHGLNEDLYLKELKKQINSRVGYLESKKLPAKFTKLERERIAYDEIKDVFYYPVYRRFFSKKKAFKASDAYNNFLDSMFVEKPELLQFNSYKNFIIRYVEKKTMKAGSYAYPKEGVLKQIDYVVETMKDEKVIDFLVNTFVYPYISSKGINGNDILIKRFNQIVKCEKYKSKFNDLVKRYEGLQKGKPAYNFRFKDINNKEVSLKDLKGKYVYINVWASWNYQYKSGIRYYTQLVNEYSGKNISFVSISLDSRYTNWKYYVKKRKVPGMHLYAGTDKEFSENYLITNVPRYVLIDKDGKIIASHAHRPVSKEIREELNQLAGI